MPLAYDAHLEMGPSNDDTASPDQNQDTQDLCLRCLASETERDHIMYELQALQLAYRELQTTAWREEMATRGNMEAAWVEGQKHLARDLEADSTAMQDQLYRLKEERDAAVQNAKSTKEAHIAAMSAAAAREMALEAQLQSNAPSEKLLHHIKELQEDLSRQAAAAKATESKLRRDMRMLECSMDHQGRENQAKEKRLKNQATLAVARVNSMNDELTKSEEAHEETKASLETMRQDEESLLWAINEKSKITYDASQEAADDLILARDAVAQLRARNAVVLEELHLARQWISRLTAMSAGEDISNMISNITGLLKDRETMRARMLDRASAAIEAEGLQRARLEIAVAFHKAGMEEDMGQTVFSVTESELLAGVALLQQAEKGAQAAVHAMEGELVKALDMLHEQMIQTQREREEEASLLAVQVEKERLLAFARNSELQLQLKAAEERAIQFKAEITSLKAQVHENKK